MPRSVTIGILIGWALPTAALAQEQEPPESGTLRSVRIERRNVFSADEVESSLIYRFGNFLHSTTDAEVIRRHVWVPIGERIDFSQVEELERNLRATRLFGAVDTSLRDLGDGDVELAIDTRDRFSLLIGGGVSFIGGVENVRGAISESNLFGTGKSISLSSRESADERQTRVRFSDAQFLGTWHRLFLAGGETEEGPFGEFGITRPLVHLADPLSYGLSGRYIDHAVDYFLAGDSEIEIPEVRKSLEMFVGRTFGPRDLRTTLGVDVRFRDSSYASVATDIPHQVRTPEDVTEYQLGAFARVNYIEKFRKIQFLDALDYWEDLPLGARADLRIAGVLRDEKGIDPQLQPLVGLGMRAAIEPFENTFLTAEASGFLRWRSDQTQGWRASVALHAFNLDLPYQTLAASLSFTAADELQDLVPQFTLGEDNGLRGYPAREFAGRRFVRLNVEDRIRTNLSIYSVRVGIAAFFDAGWVHGSEQGLSIRDAITSAGVGFRFGSSHLMGSNVVRFDIAWPLTDVNGTDFGVSFSVSSGQMFSFFGNRTELRSEF